MDSDRLPPHDHPSEQGAIGSQLDSPNDCIAQVFEKTGGDVTAFYDPRHQEIQTVLFELWSEQRPVDLLTIQTRLIARGNLDQTGGLIYLMELQGASVSAWHLPEYLRVLGEKWLLRRMLQCCGKFSQLAMESDAEAENTADAFEREVMALRKIHGSDSVKPIREIVHESINDIEAMFQRKGAISGLSTGLPDSGRPDGRPAPGGLHPHRRLPQRRQDLARYEHC